MKTFLVTGSEVHLLTQERIRVPVGRQTRAVAFTSYKKARDEAVRFCYRRERFQPMSEVSKNGVVLATVALENGAPRIIEGPQQ